jgi:hypothetical protein
MLMGWGHPQRTRDAWTLPMGWTLPSAHIAFKRRWVEDKWCLGSPRPNYPWAPHAIKVKIALGY